jgi:hypothetical protein
MPASEDLHSLRRDRRGERTIHSDDSPVCKHRSSRLNANRSASGSIQAG